MAWPAKPWNLYVYFSDLKYVSYRIETLTDECLMCVSHIKQCIQDKWGKEIKIAIES